MVDLPSPRGVGVILRGYYFNRSFQDSATIPRDDDVLSILAVGESFEDRELDFGLVFSVRLEFVGENPDFCGEIGDEFRCLRHSDLNVTVEAL